MLDRHIEHYGKAPRQSAADGGYASTANLAQAKALGVRDAFHKNLDHSLLVEADISCAASLPWKAWIHPSRRPTMMPPPSGSRPPTVIADQTPSRTLCLPPRPENTDVYGRKLASFRP